MRKASILAALLLVAPALSHAKTLEDLLVEKGVITKGEAKEAMGSAPAKVYYNGGTRIEFPDAGFTSQINTLLQTRYTFVDADEDAGERNVSSFDVNKAQLKIKGNALHEEFSYAMMADFADTSNGSHLRDGWIAWHGCDWFAAKLGQFKTGLSRQYNAGDENLQFADRSIVSDYFSQGRQGGAHLSTDLMDGALKLGAGVFNGSSDGEGTNLSGVDTRHTGIVNLRYNVMGKMDPFVEGDVDWTENAALNLGAAYGHAQFNDKISDTMSDTFDADTVNVDAVLKTQGFSLAGEYYVQDVSGDATDLESTQQGFYVQAGYFLKPKTLELAARYGLVDCDDGKACTQASTPLDSVSQVSASINYYWWKHQMKAQFGYDIVSRDAVGTDDNSNYNRWILQLTSAL